MRLTITIAAILLIAFAGIAQAGVVFQVSNSFGIDNEAGDTIPKPPTAWADSPYDNGFTGQLLRGQLHCHSIQDIDHLIQFSMKWDFLAQDYANVGFDFVALTNHYTVSKDLDDPALLWIPGSMELTPDPAAGVAYGCPATWINLPHVLAIGTQSASNSDLWANHGYSPSVVDSVKIRASNIHSKNGLALIAHPDDEGWGVKAGFLPLYHNFAVSAKDLRLLYSGDSSVKPDGIAIYNSGGGGHYADVKWDEVLRSGYKVWGFAEEDFHPKQGFEMGKAWVAVPGSSSDDWGPIKSKLSNGQYYSYWVTGGKWPASLGSPPKLKVTTTGTSPYPTITAAVLDDGNNPVQVDSITFVTGKSRVTVNGSPKPSSASYNCTGHEGYVRVEFQKSYTGAGNGAGTLHAASQPVFICATGAVANYPANRVSLMSTSPDLNTRYLEAADVPIPPVAGYIGYVYGVSSADGQVPPGAKLQLNYIGADLGPLGGTQYLAIYHYDETAQQWVKIGGTVDPGTQTIESPITELGKYCVSADLPTDTTFPQILVDNPVTGAVVSTDTTLKATVNDNIGAWRVTFYLNDHPIGVDAFGGDGWTADLKITDYCTGNWTLKAVAEDLAGNTGTAEIPIYIASSTPKPTVTITSPASGATISGITTVAGTCWDDVAVAAVNLSIDDILVGYGEINGNNWTCDIDPSLLLDGSRTLTATVEDHPGNSVSVSRPVTINSGAVSYAPGKAKTLNDGDSVRIGNSVVVALPALTGDGYYIESTSRGSAIRLRTGKTLNLGDKVNLVGTVNASAPEKAVEASDISVASSGNTIKPLGTSPRYFYLTPDSVGKVVKIWGRLGSIDSSSPAKWFILKDPSGIDVKCMLADGVTINPAWSFISVVGVISGELGTPVLLVNKPTDIKNLLGP